MAIQTSQNVTADNQCMYISGVINFNNVMDIERSALLLLAEQDKVCRVSFSRLTAMNSAGLSLIVSIFTYMNRFNRSVVFEDLPENAIKLSKISDLHTLLPLK